MDKPVSQLQLVQAQKAQQTKKIRQQISEMRKDAKISIDGTNVEVRYPKDSIIADLNKTYVSLQDHHPQAVRVTIIDFVSSALKEKDEYLDSNESIEDKFGMSQQLVGAAMRYLSDECTKPVADHYAVDYISLLVALQRRKMYVILVTDKPAMDEIGAFWNYKRLLEYACGAVTAEECQRVNTAWLDDFDTLCMQARCRCIQSVRANKLYRERFHPIFDCWKSAEIEPHWTSRMALLKDSDTLSEMSDMAQLESYWMARAEICEMVGLRVLSRHIHNKSTIEDSYHQTVQQLKFNANVNFTNYEYDVVVHRLAAIFSQLQIRRLLSRDVMDRLGTVWNSRWSMCIDSFVAVLIMSRIIGLNGMLHKLSCVAAIHRHMGSCHERNLLSEEVFIA